MTRVVPATITATRPEKATDQHSVREAVGMRKWLRLTARKHSAAKQSENDAARAAADALDSLLRGARKRG